MKKVLLLGLFLSAMLLPANAWALVGPAQPCDLKSFEGSFKCVAGRIREEAGVAETEPREVILSILRTLLTLTAVVGTIAAIIAGVMYMTSAGDEGKAEKAKHALVYLVIGLVILGAAILVVNLIINTLIGVP